MVPMIGKSYPLGILWTACFCGLVACGQGPTQTELLYPESSLADLVTGPAGAELVPSSLHDPHRPAAVGPWFEGWYTRIVDVGGSRSVAVIGTSYLPPGMVYTPGMHMPGYLAVLVSEGDGAPTYSYEVYCDRVTFRVGGEIVSDNPDLKSPADFEWTAEGYGSITEDSIDVTIPGLVTVKAQMSEPVPWNARTGTGPEGFMSFLPLPLHWHVASLGSAAEYQYTIEDQGQSRSVAGTGWAHQEKNWGEIFPPAWIWGEGVTGNNSAQIAFAGGKAALGPFTLTTWLVGFRSPAVAWDFRASIPGTIFHSEIDACSGQYFLQATNAVQTLTIEASAPLDTFASVSIPTEDGYRPNGGIESFSADIIVRAYRHDPLGGLLGIKRLVDEQFFTNAALEFGADYQCAP